MRAQHITAQNGEAVHIYSKPGTIILQLRREVATQTDPHAASFKVAVELTAAQALAVACELLTVAHASISKTAPAS
jgi:hypothetical protein